MRLWPNGMPLIYARKGIDDCYAICYHENTMIVSEGCYK